MIRENVREDAIICFFGILSAILFAAGFVIMIEAVIEEEPVVLKSARTGECVEVLFDDNYSCDNLPERYSLEWVE